MNYCNRAVKRQVRHAMTDDREEPYSSCDLDLIEDTRWQNDDEDDKVKELLRRTQSVFEKRKADKKFLSAVLTCKYAAVLSNMEKRAGSDALKPFSFVDKDLLDKICADSSLKEVAEKFGKEKSAASQTWGRFKKDLNKPKPNGES